MHYIFQDDIELIFTYKVFCEKDVIMSEGGVSMNINHIICSVKK